MTPISFNAAQALYLSIGGTAEGQAFGFNRDNPIGGKRGFTKSNKPKRRRNSK